MNTKTTATKTAKTISVHSTGEQVVCDVLNQGLAHHAGGKHQQMYAREDLRTGTPRYFRTNPAGRWTLCHGHTLNHARSAFAQYARAVLAEADALADDQRENCSNGYGFDLCGDDNSDRF